MPDDEKLDEAIEETFPASDAPGNTVETGIQAGAPPFARPAVTDNDTRQRFELRVNGETAFLAYERTPDTLTIIHTEVPRDLRGRYLGESLVDAAAGDAHARGLRLAIECPFARAYLRKHPEKA